MKECTCKHCVCLVENIYGELECDEVGKRIEEITVCPEGVEDDEFEV